VLQGEPAPRVDMQCQPQAQISMNWGTNWHNLHNLLAMNIAASDLGPVRLMKLSVRTCLHRAQSAGGPDYLCFVSTPPACG